VVQGLALKVSTHDGEGNEVGHGAILARGSMGSQ
jgi:hypothetical protein